MKAVGVVEVEMAREEEKFKLYYVMFLQEILMQRRR